MPRMKEAAVAVAGTIVAIEAQPEYDDKGNKTGSIKGQKIMLQAAGLGDGYASVTLDLSDYASVKPTIGEQVSWMIRYGAYAQRGTAENSCRFVRIVTDDDFRALAASELVTSV